LNNHWNIFAKKTFTLEKKYSKYLSVAITRYRNSFITNLKENGKETATQRLHLTHLNPELTKILTAIYKEGGLLGARMSFGEFKANQKAANFGRNATWIQEVANFLRLHLLKFVSRITETMRNDIIKVLEKATEEGWSIDRTVQELRRKDVVQARARTIARTEIVRAANVGHQVGAKSLPYEMNKKWISAKDHRTRHSHREVNNHVTDEEGTFKVGIYEGDKLVGYEEMKYPGDANAHPSNTINCRCRIIFEAKRDSHGKLIPRSSNTATIIPMQEQYTTLPAHQIAAALKAHIFAGIEED
jgi:uncharacterized protein with gpF-like domain